MNLGVMIRSLLKKINLPLFLLVLLVFLLPFFKVPVIFIFVLLLIGAGAVWVERLSQQEKDHLIYQNRQLQYVDQLTQAMRKSMDLSEVLGLVQANLIKELKYDRVILFNYLVEKRGHDCLQPMVCSGLDFDAVKDYSFKIDKRADILPRSVVERQPFIVTNAPEDHRCDQKFVGLLGLKNYVVVPFIIKDQPLGALLADRQTSQVPITEEEIPILQMFANQAGLAIENAKLYKQIEDLAITDGLTNLFNHRYFQDCLKLEVQRMSRYENRHDICLSLLMIDVDHFKQYNDTYGHQAGDRVLNEMGQLLKNSLRKVDVVARYGGEEFVIVLPMTTKEQAVMLAERLRASVEKYPFETADKTSLGPVTISLGVATYREDGMNEQDLIGIADQCLYAAKQAGRNCVRHRPIEKEQPVQ